MSDQKAVETGWNIHSALCDWTGKVDSKASFLSAIDLALLGALAALAGDGHLLSDLRGFWQHLLLWVGVVLLVFATALVLWVVSPHLGTASGFRNSAKDNFIFFGHLQHWKPDELEPALRDREVLPMLAQQLVAMGRIAWKKHKRLQYSVLCTVAGTVLVALAAFIRQIREG